MKLAEGVLLARFCHSQPGFTETGEASSALARLGRNLTPSGNFRSAPVAL
jgi:hypothetical protein